MELPGHDRAAAAANDSAERIAEARLVAQDLVRRTKRVDAAAVRSSFAALPIERRRADSFGAMPEPTVATLLRGGRGGEVKLKVELSALWIAVAEPYDVTLPARVWARLIGLPDPDKRGAHRVSSAIRQLVKQGLLAQHGSAGTVPTLELCSETSPGEPYQSPGARIGELKAAGEDFTAHRYFKVPNELWTHGWIVVLGGPALAMLLVLLQLSSGRDTENHWFSPAVADQRFGLSEETRRRGLTQLEEFGLVTTGRRPVTSSNLEAPRFRNTYSLNLDYLQRATPMSHRMHATFQADAIHPQTYIVDDADSGDLESVLEEVKSMRNARLRTASVWAVVERTGVRMPIKASELHDIQRLPSSAAQG